MYSNCTGVESVGVIGRVRVMFEVMVMVRVKSRDIQGSETTLKCGGC